MPYQRVLITHVSYRSSEKMLTPRISNTFRGPITMPFNDQTVLTDSEPSVS